MMNRNCVYLLIRDVETPADALSNCSAQTAPFTFGLPQAEITGDIETEYRQLISA